MSRGGTFIELLVALAVESDARNAALRFLDAAAPDTRLALACRDDLAALPPMAELTDRLDTERFHFIDVCQFFRHDGAEMLKQLGLNPSSNEGAGMTEGDLRRVDWNRTLRYGNGIFDRYAAALRLPTPRERAGPMAALEVELKELQQYREGLDAGRRILLLLLPPVEKVAVAADRQRAQFQTELLAFALAGHKAGTGRYPVTLAELVPKYAAAVPTDHFTGQGFLYTTTADGYQFYSVGPDGKDHGGQFMDDEPRGDDIGVRMPNVKKRPPSPLGGAGG
jgi:hypothetical protein